MNRLPPRNVGNRKGLSRAEIQEGIELIDHWGQDRPKNRSECRGGARPCPYVSCRYNLYLDARDRQVRLNFPHLEPDEMSWSCVLDEIDQFPDGMTLEQIGERMNITRERVRQLEAEILPKLKLMAAHSDQLQSMIAAWEARRRQDTELIITDL
jgi:hypothetical protein